MREVRLIGLETIPIVEEGDDIGELICQAAEREGVGLQDGDVIVVSHIIISRAEGRVVDLADVEPSEFAKNIARELGKDPRLVEVVLRESRAIVRMGDGHLICRTKHGFVCANAGVDRSNVPGEGRVALLPEDPDLSARRIRERIRQLTGKDVAIIISDTHGRPLRRGTINVAIGVAGLEPIWDRRGDVDLFGYMLRATQVAVADELASAAELLMGQAGEGIPVVIIRGYGYKPSERASARELVRPREEDLFM